MNFFKQLKDVIVFKSGGTPSKKIPEYWNGNIPWATVKDFTSTRITETQDYISEKGLTNSSARLVPKGHVIIPTRMAVGKAAINTIDLAINQDLRALIPKPGIDARYLLYAILSLKEQMERKSSGATVKGITQENLYNLSVFIPPLNDQKRIAHLLGKVENLIAQRKRHLQQLDDLLKSVFLEMFGDPVRNEKAWNVSTIGLMCDVKGGKRIPKGDKLVQFNTGYPYIKAGNIKSGEVTTKGLEFVTPSVRKKISRYVVSKGDVCITVVGANIGDVGIVPAVLDRASLTENANKLLIRDKRRLDNHYLANFLMSDYVQKQIVASIRAAGVPKLAIFRIEEIQMLIPPIDVQYKFRDIKSNIRVLINQYQKNLDDLNSLYGALSQKAFKGELDLSEVPLLEELTINPKHDNNLAAEDTKRDAAPEPEFPIGEIDKIIRRFSQFDNASLSDDTLRKNLFSQWFTEWLAQFNAGTEINLDHFWQSVQLTAVDYTDEEENPFSVSLRDYDLIKEEIFKAIKQGRIEQTINMIEVGEDGKKVLEPGNQILLKNSAKRIYG